MSSEITLSTEALAFFEEAKTSKTYRYVIYEIRKDQEIMVDTIGQRDDTYEEFRDKLLKNYEDHCRCIVFDYPGTNEADDKLMLINWIPESASVRERLIYSNSYETMKKTLQGVKKYLDVVAIEELDDGILNDEQTE